VRKRGSQLGSSSSTEGTPAEGPIEPEPAADRVKVGRLGRPNGLQGFIGLYVSDADLVYFEPGSSVHVGDGAYTVRAIRRGNKGPQIAFSGIDDRESAEAIRGNDVFATERRALVDDEFWHDDLIGLEVTPGGGRVVAVVPGPAQDRLVIERDGARFEVPFVDELVPSVDLAAGQIEVVEIEGLS
jgi:16S rRNA processing protein RimM